MKQATSRILFALAVAAIPLSASADNAFTMRDVEVYTGPGSEYPPVATLPPNTAVEIAGCLSDWSWCDINFADSRGWVYAADLGYPYQNNRVVIIEYGPRLGIPVVAFSLPAYWDAHYRGRPWYRERDVWVNRVHAQVDRGGRPPQGRARRSLHLLRWRRSPRRLGRHTWCCTRAAPAGSSFGRARRQGRCFTRGRSRQAASFATHSRRPGRVSGCGSVLPGTSS